MTDLQPGGRISLHDAAALFAQHDPRSPESPRAAEQRARTRIDYAVKKGLLDRAADKSFSVDDFMAWATTVNKALRTAFPEFARGEYVARINGKIVAYASQGMVTMDPHTSLDDANKQAVLDKLTIRLLRKELARSRLRDREQNNKMRRARRFKRARQP